MGVTAGTPLAPLAAPGSVAQDARMLEADLIVRNAAELCTLAGDKSSGAETALAPLTNGTVACRAGRIVWVGPENEREPAVTLVPGGAQVDASGCTVTPGFVDCHTHVVFAGDRADEFAMRCAGATYLEIARAGGGIQSTVRATRAASEEQLVSLALPRLRRLLSFGITTAEAKSGYGLEREAELRMLRAIRRLGNEQPVELVATLLCAHAIPSEYADRREAWVAVCADQIVPAVAEEKLAVFCDAFVEQGAFTVEEARTILARAKALGMRPRLHADQMSSMGASALAAELGAATADHLEYADDAAIARLKEAGVAAVLVPASTFFLRQPHYAPGRKLWDAGVEVALATNVNPGSAMSENANLTLSLACLYNGLTPAEALYAFTRGSARALRLDDRVGSLRPGMQADLVVHGCPSHRHLPYHLGVNQVREVVKRGRVVWRTHDALA